MKNQNIILDFEDFLNTYENKNYMLNNECIRQLFPLTLVDSLSEKYAYLVGKIMGDGHLDNKYTLYFISSNKNDLKLLCNLIIRNFKISPYRISIKKRIVKGVSYLLRVNCAYLGRILYLLGAPKGNKTKTAFDLPKWILANKILKKRFLQALLEDELTTIKIEKCNYSVCPRLKLAKKEELIPNLRDFMQQVKDVIESFGVQCSHISNPVNGNNTDSLELYFHINQNKKNIIKFKEEIGFRLNQDKIRKLDDCYRVLKATI
jgi:intein/homing endonuclease|tara:strand:- start:218 stop:1003 length:786 start_codon:yes stop_codon:yes gene_type:complete